MCSRDLSSSLQAFLNVASGFTVTWGIGGHVSVYGHMSSNDCLVKCFFSLLIAERGAD